jgi:hypothetical protein
LAVLHGVCNAHGRRQFVDVQQHFPEQVHWVLEHYQHIWVNDDVCAEKVMDSEHRLAYHAEHSLPVMQEIRAWGAQQIDEQGVEPNSGLGKAIGYFERHFDRLTLFCKTEGAKIDNNVMEAALKLIVRNRKNAYFYKTPAGAGISDVITSCIATTQLAHINVFDYFNAIQRHRAAVKDNPEQWLPWNYTENPQMTALSN